MNFDEAIEGSLLVWVASGKSPHTARLYKLHLKKTWSTI